MLAREKVRRSIADEVQYAGVVEADAEKAIGDDERQRQQCACAHERKYADEKTDADDGKVFEFPQPERSFGREVIRVDVQCLPPK